MKSLSKCSCVLGADPNAREQMAITPLQLPRKTGMKINPYSPFTRRRSDLKAKTDKTPLDLAMGRVTKKTWHSEGGNHEEVKPKARVQALCKLKRLPSALKQLLISDSV